MLMQQLTGEGYVDEDGNKGRRKVNKAAGVDTAVTVAMVAIVAVVLLRIPPPARRQPLARLFKRR
jgi:hypothetical protein